MKNSQFRFLIILVLVLTSMACRRNSISANESSEVPNHLLWDSLLSTHVDDFGLVDYRGFMKDSLLLSEYLNQLSANAPNSEWSNDDQLAYWINLYNAATIKLITQHYPIKSIKDIGSSIQIPFVNTPWQMEFININGEIIDLDRIEHGIIQKEFDEPRIHFALVCAARSCPKLRNEAYQGSLLNLQLNDQAKLFLSDKTKNDISANHVVISKLFRWYGDDFKKKTTLIEYLNEYSPAVIHEDIEIDFMNYDWKLNELSPLNKL